MRAAAAATTTMTIPSTLGRAVDDGGGGGGENVMRMPRPSPVLPIDDDRESDGEADENDHMLANQLNCLRNTAARLMLVYNEKNHAYAFQLKSNVLESYTRQWGAWQS